MQTEPLTWKKNTHTNDTSTTNNRISQNRREAAFSLWNYILFLTVPLAPGSLLFHQETAVEKDKQQRHTTKYVIGSSDIASLCQVSTWSTSQGRAELWNSQINFKQVVKPKEEFRCKDLYISWYICANSHSLLAWAGILCTIVHMPIIWILKKPEREKVKPFPCSRIPPQFLNVGRLVWMCTL